MAMKDSEIDTCVRYLEMVIDHVKRGDFDEMKSTDSTPDRTSYFGAGELRPWGRYLSIELIRYSSDYKLAKSREEDASVKRVRLWAERQLLADNSRWKPGQDYHELAGCGCSNCACARQVLDELEGK